MTVTAIVRTAAPPSIGEETRKDRRRRARRLPVLKRDMGPIEVTLKLV
jgi:hypothetical protein